MGAFLKEFQHLKIQLKEIMSATNNFDNNNVIGEGGFGKVYRGVFSHSEGKTMVAFKRLDSNRGQGHSEFLKEILLLSRYTHKNLITLLGFCDEFGEKILVYEHASRGGLDRHLTSTTLRWRQRLEICLAAATGLCFLHDPKETQQRVIHRDIKSSNILLDDNWNAKISDMGLSQIGPANQKNTFLVSDVAGTFGYVDPEYLETNILTKESDVYSFGVVLAEVLCGRPCYENVNGRIQTLGQTWKKSYKLNKLDDIIFQDLKQQMDPSSLKAFSDIVYRCLKKSREKRPSMHHVVEKLQTALWFQEIFEGGKPPLHSMNREVNKFIQELQMFLSKGITFYKSIGDICMWRSPMITVIVHLLIPYLVWDPRVISTVVFSFIIAKGILNFRHRHTLGKKISEFADHQYRLQTVAGEIQAVVGGIAVQRERMNSLLGWKETQTTTIFLIYCLTATIVCYMIPLEAIAFVIGMYIMRHPRFRSRHLPSVHVNFFRRQQANDDFFPLFAFSEWFSDICMWRNRKMTAWMYLIFTLVICFPTLIFPAVFLSMFVHGIYNFLYGRGRMHQDDIMNTKISQAQGVYPDDHLPSGAGEIQALMRDITIHGKRLQSLLSWRYTDTTGLFMLVCFGVTMVMAVIPFRFIPIFILLYVIRSPNFCSDAYMISKRHILQYLINRL